MSAGRRVPGLVALVVAAAWMAGCASREAPGIEIAPMEVRAEDGVGTAERMLVWRASVRLRAKEPAEAGRQVQDRAAALGGNVDRNVVATNHADLRLRIPTERLEEFLELLPEVGEVDRQSVSFEDVTLDAIDLDARLTNLISVRDRLQQHLDRTTDVTEILAVERELARVQGEIDSLSGRLAHLRSTSTYASVLVRIDRQRVLGPLGLVVAGGGWLLSRLVFLR